MFHVDNDIAKYWLTITLPETVNQPASQKQLISQPPVFHRPQGKHAVCDRITVMNHIFKPKELM